MNRRAAPKCCRLRSERLESRLLLAASVCYPYVPPSAAVDFVPAAEVARVATVVQPKATSSPALPSSLATLPSVSDDVLFEAETSGKSPAGMHDSDSGPAQAHSAGSLGVIVPLYQYPLSAPGTLSPWWQQAVEGATQATPLTIIANPASGPIDLGHANYNDWITGLSQLRDNPNIRILGYVSTRLAVGSDVVRGEDAILGDVARYADAYQHAASGGSLIDGIFLDEMSSRAEDVDVFQRVAAGIRLRSDLAGQYIVGNPGTTMPVSYIENDTADQFVVREGSPSALFANAFADYVTDPALAHKEFGAIIHSASGSGDLAEVLREVKLRGLDSVFVTDDSGGNPFDRSPSFFGELLRDVHAPFIASETFEVAEFSQAGTVVGIPQAGDPNPGQTIRYRMIGGNPDDAFSIDADTGAIRVQNSAALDHATRPVVELLIEVADDDTPVLLDQATIRIELLKRPEIQQVQINQGSASRSQVTSLGVVFDSQVDPEEIRSAFELVNVDSGLAVGQVHVSHAVAGGRTQVTLTFSGDQTIDRLGTEGQGNSLVDGNFRLRVIAASVVEVTGLAAMQEDYFFGGQLAGESDNDNFFRLLGDANGDGLRDQADYDAILPTLFNPAGYREDMDTNGDGVITGVDLNGLLPTLHGEGRR